MYQDARIVGTPLDFAPVADGDVIQSLLLMIPKDQRNSVLAKMVELSNSMREDGAPAALMAQAGRPVHAGASVVAGGVVLLDLADAMEPIASALRLSGYLH